MFISSCQSHSRTLLNPHLSPNRVSFVLQVWLSTHIFIFLLRFATVKSPRTVPFTEEMQPNVALALSKSFTSALFKWHVGRSHRFLAPSSRLQTIVALAWLIFLVCVMFKCVWNVLYLCQPYMTHLQKCSVCAQQDNSHYLFKGSWRVAP